MKLKSLISTQNIFHTSEFSVQSGSKLVNFGLMLDCFGPVRSGENIIGSVRGRGHKIYYFSVLSGSGKKITGQYGFGVPKTLPRRSLQAMPLKCSICRGSKYAQNSTAIWAPGISKLQALNLFSGPYLLHNRYWNKPTFSKARAWS